MRPALRTLRTRIGRPFANLLLAVLLPACVAFGSQTLTSAEARNHIGETATVCGHVTSAHYSARGNGQPTFINLDKPYPKSVFHDRHMELGPGEVRSAGDCRG